MTTKILTAALASSMFTLKAVGGNVGSPIEAPPISYSVKGKQYVAILVGARMWPYIVQNAPELKNLTTSSMLYVFSL
jgi:alcohol dehydrogenase (cytochrome c)